MSSHLRTAWRKLSSWRAFSDSDYWNDYDAVVSSETTRRGNLYDVYTYGQLIATAVNLDLAKSTVEVVYGPLEWKRVELPAVEVDHVYFGETDEFSDPRTIYVVEHLPELN